MSMRTEVHETRTYPFLSSRTCSTSCRAGVKEEVENSVEEKLLLFLLILTIPNYYASRYSSSSSRNLVSLIHLRERKIYRLDLSRVISRIFKQHFYRRSYTSVQEEIPPLLKNRVEKRKYTRSMAQSTRDERNTQQRWNPCQWPRASPFYRTVYNHASKPSITTCTTNGGSLVATRGEERERKRR